MKHYAIVAAVLLLNVTCQGVELEQDSARIGKVLGYIPNQVSKLFAKKCSITKKRKPSLMDSFLYCKDPAETIQEYVDKEKACTEEVVAPVVEAWCKPFDNKFIKAYVEKEIRNPNEDDLLRIPEVCYRGALDNRDANYQMRSTRKVLEPLGEAKARKATEDEMKEFLDAVCPAGYEEKDHTETCTVLKKKKTECQMWTENGSEFKIAYSVALFEPNLHRIKGMGPIELNDYDTNDRKNLLLKSKCTPETVAKLLDRLCA